MQQHICYAEKNHLKAMNERTAGVITT